MSETEQITVSLPRDVVERVRSAVRSGEYASVAQAVAAAVVLWDAQHSEVEPDTETLRRLVAEGLASGEPIDADDVFFALNARVAKLRAAE